MTLVEESLALQNIYDLLYYTGMNEEQKQYWRSIREKYVDEMDKNQAFKSAWNFLSKTDKIDPISGEPIINDYQTLLRAATEQVKAEKSYPNYFATLLKTNPQLKTEIEQGLSTAATWAAAMAWPKRYAIYKELDNKVKFTIKSNPQEDQAQIKKSLDDILTVLHSYESKMSPTNRVAYYRIQAPYTDVPADQYYTDQHIDDLLKFYNTLKLRPVEIELAALESSQEREYKKGVLSTVKFETLGIVKSLKDDIKKVITNDVEYLQKASGKKVTFGQTGYSNEVFEGFDKKGLAQVKIDSINAIADRAEKITGQKIVFT